MVDERDAPAAAVAPVWPMYRALVGVGALCGLLIVSVFLLTLPVIQANEADYLQRAVFKVLPGAVDKRSFFLDETGSFRAVETGDAPARTVHAGYDGQGELIGVAIPGQGMGYADTIRVLFGYAPGQEAIVGLQVLASKETPGLGDKIEKDPNFVLSGLGLSGRGADHVDRRTGLVAEVDGSVIGAGMIGLEIRAEGGGLTGCNGAIGMDRLEYGRLDTG